MSRAFVTDKEDWIYCVKAGERCLHAEAGKECRKTDCEFFGKEVNLAESGSASVKVVKRQKKEKAAETKQAAEKPRKTKKSSLPKPRRWGGRSDFVFPTKPKN